MDQPILIDWAKFAVHVSIGSHMNIKDGVVDLEVNGFVMRYEDDDGWGKPIVWIQPLSHVREWQINPLYAKYQIDGQWITFEQVMA